MSAFLRCLIEHDDHRLNLTPINSMLDKGGTLRFKLTHNLTSSWMYYSEDKQSGAVEACWAHNPEVRGSKPRSAKVFFPSKFDMLSHSPNLRLLLTFEVCMEKILFD